MRWAKTVVVGAVLLFAGSCFQSGPDNHPIPPGVFYSEDGVEQIAIGEEAIYFMIRRRGHEADDKIPGRVSPYIAFYPSMYLDRAREYTVEEDGEINLHLYISTDPFLFLRLFWHEDSGKIELSDEITGETVWFVSAVCEGVGDGPCSDNSSQ